MIVESAREVSIERGRLRVVLATIAINIVAVSLLVVAPWSNWRTGLALNLVDNCLLVGFALVRRDDKVGLHRGRIVDLCLLHRRVLHYGSIISVNFTVLSSAKDITQLVFGSFQNALLLLWKIFAGAIDVEI